MFEDRNGLSKNAIILSENLTKGERLQLYNEWAESYDKDMKSTTYKSHHKIAETLASYLSADRTKCTIIDIAAGTGLEGGELHNVGFRIIDAVEPAQKMLDIAKKKSIYRNCICAYVTEKPLDIPEDTYDGLTLCGGFGYGHVPCGALYELIRVVKPGGYIVMATNPSYLDTCPEYKGNFKALVDQLVTDRKWKEIKTEIFSNYAPDVDGLLMVYQKL